ncbi:MAG: hypothetical protein IKQ36_03030 [Clostridia bacterium]|nr:hypothetical protein [Clostridia bacterium]
MKKNSALWMILLAVVFAGIILIAFIIPVKKSVSFWVAFGFTVLAFALQYPIWRSSVGNADTTKSTFLGLPVLYVGLVYLLAQIIVFAVVTAVAGIIPVWLSIILCVLTLCFFACCVLMTKTGNKEIARVEQKVQGKVSAMKALQADVEMLAASEKDAETKNALLSLAKKIRYSDPMSCDELSEIESRIMEQIAQLKNVKDKTAAIQDIDLLITERNAKCKILK